MTGRSGTAGQQRSSASAAQTQRQLEDQYHKARYAEKLVRGLIAQYNAGPGATSGFSGFVKDLAPTQANREYNRGWQILDEYGPSLLGSYYNVPSGTSAWSRDTDQAERLNHLLANAQAAQRDAVRGLQATPDKNGVLVPLAPPPRPPPPPPPASQAQTGSSRPQTKQSPAIVQLRPPPPAAQSQENRLAKGNTKDVVDQNKSAKISALIRGDYSLDQINSIVPSTLDSGKLAYSRELAKNPNYNGKPIVTFIVPKDTNAFERFAASDAGLGITNYARNAVPIDWFLDDEKLKLVDKELEAHPFLKFSTDLAGQAIGSELLNPLKEGLVERFFPDLEEKSASLVADTVGDSVEGFFDAPSGLRTAGGVGGFAKSALKDHTKKYVDDFKFDFLNEGSLPKKLADKGIDLAVDSLYDAGKEQLESLSPEGAAEGPRAELDNQATPWPRSYQSQGISGGSLVRAGTPASLLSPEYGQPEPVFRSYVMPGAPWVVRQHGMLVPVDQLRMARSGDLLRGNNPVVPAAAQPAPAPKVVPQAAPSKAPIPTADQGTANFYAQLGNLKRNADAMAVGPYPNPGDAARAAQLFEPRPVYPTNHPYGFGAGFEPDQVASGRPYAVAPQGVAVPADDQGAIVYHPQSLAAHYYGAQPAVGLYGDAGGDPRYGLSYDDGAGGYAQGGSDGFDFLSPASVHAGGWQHPADALGQGAELLVAAPGARFSYGSAAPAPVIGGIIPLGLGAAPRSEGSGGGSGSVPLYSSYTGYGGAGAVDAQPAVAPVSDPSGWSPRSAVRNILAIAPDDGQGAPSWLDPNTPPPQIMINVPDLSGLIR